jgi:hypothetical protein
MRKTNAGRGQFCSNCGSQAVGYEENTKGTEEELVHSSKLTGSSLKSKVIICVLAIIVLTGVFAIWPKSIEHGNTAGNLNNYGELFRKKMAGFIIQIAVM